MTQQFIRTFYSKAEYEAFLEADREAQKRKNIEAALARSRKRQRPNIGYRTAQKVNRTLEELAQFIEDVRTGRDEVQRQAERKRFLKSMRLVQGGSPGLSR